MSDTQPSHFYFSPRCLFCNKNNGRRNTKKGRYWKCRHCGEMNPGPAMVKAMVGRFTTPPRGTAKHDKLTPAAVTSNGAAPATPPPAAPAKTTVAKTTAIAVAKPAKAKAEKETSTPTQPAPAVTRQAPAPPPPSKKLKGLAGVIFG